MIGILAEKSSAANSFAKALGGMRGTYDGQPYQIISAAGHLYEFVDPDEMVDASNADKYKYWNIKNLPWSENDLKWIKREKKDEKGKSFYKPKIKSIKQSLSECDEIVIGTDVDPSGEGDLLAWEILQNIPLKGKKITRMYHDDESEKEVLRALKERKVIKNYKTDPLYMKADFRSKWDYMSMQWTRVATACGDGKSVLRNGRLKSVMVVFVGDALEALKNYVKTPFYQNRFKDENGNIYESKDEPKFKTKDEVPLTYKTSDVVLDKKEIKHTAPPKLIDLMGIAASLSTKGFKSDEILKVYQSMYSDQIVSYPRTEDDVITPGQFDEMLKLVDKIADVVGVDKSLLTHRSPRPSHVSLTNSRKKKVSHGANRPGVRVPESLESLKAAYGKSAPYIYELLARNFLGMFAEDYEYEQQTGHVQEYPSFIGTARIPLKSGWKDIYQEDDDQKDDGKGLGKRAEPFVYEGFNKKPPAPTMRWLKTNLEKHDVGTGATRTSIYAEVTNEKYKYPLLKDTNGKITMTEFGEMNYALLQNTHIGDVGTTEKLMQQMRDVESGSGKQQDYLHEIQQMIKDDIETMKKNGEKIGKKPVSPGRKKTVELDIKCTCGGSVEERTSEFGKYYMCPGCRRVVSAELCGHKFTTKEVKGLFNDEKVGPIKFHSEKKKKDFDACVQFNDEKKAQFVFEPRKTEATHVLCHSCGGHMVLKEGDYGKYYECAECNTRFSKKVCEHEFNDDDVNKLFNGEKIGPFDFVSRSGNPFRAMCELDENGRIKFDFQKR